MYWADRPTRDQGNDYLHSTYGDVVLSGLVGIRPLANGTVRVRPLVPSSGADAWGHFAADHVLVHGRVLSVVWDQSGTVYGRGTGLRLWVDGVLKATAPNLDTPLSVSL